MPPKRRVGVRTMGSSREEGCVEGGGTYSVVFQKDISSAIGDTMLGLVRKISFQYQAMFFGDSR